MKKRDVKESIVAGESKERLLLGENAVFTARGMAENIFHVTLLNLDT